MASFELELRKIFAFRPQPTCHKVSQATNLNKEDFAPAAKNYSSKYGGSKNALSLVRAMGP